MKDSFFRTKKEESRKRLSEDKSQQEKKRRNVVEISGLDQKDVQTTQVCPQKENDQQTVYVPYEYNITSRRLSRVHKAAVICVRASLDCTCFYSLAKDNSVRKWSLKDCVTQLSFKTKGLKDTLLCMDISPDNKHLVVSGKKGIIYVYDADTGLLIKKLVHHRQPVLGLVFLKNAEKSILYSCGCDKLIKLWNVRDGLYIDTLFGHTDHIVDIDAIHKEKCVTGGSRDMSFRYWNTNREKHLVFGVTREEDSCDCVSMIDNNNFVGGTAKGTAFIWNTNLKKPTHQVNKAHDNSIRSLACLKFTNLFATGSSDGRLNLWKFDKHVTLVGSIEIDGFINSIEFIPSNNVESIQAIVAVGKEQRLGRWEVSSVSRNAVYLLDIRAKTSTTTEANL